MEEHDQQVAIDKTGCGELNDKLLLCYDEHRDWRKCRPEVEAFRSCYRSHAVQRQQDHAGMIKNKGA